MDERYSRQARFKGIGVEGQRKISATRMAVVGMGALGTVSANLLARAGVGHLRLIDRDLVELSNLQRQTIFTEQDARDSVPKAIAAAEHLGQVNSSIEIEPVAVDFDGLNALQLIEDVDVVIDATDNLEARYTLNEACVEAGIPWVYGAAIESQGAMMPIVPGGPCFSCYTGRTRAEGGSGPRRTCSTVGVIAPATSVAASLQCSAALKLVVGAPVERVVYQFDAWDFSADVLEVAKDPECPVCGRRRYEYLGKPASSEAAKMCGQMSVRVSPQRAGKLDLQSIAEKLGAAGTVKASPYHLDFSNDAVSFALFRDGHAIVRNVDDEGRAKSIYAEYIGL